MRTIPFYSILSLSAFDERAITKSQVMIEPRETHERCVYESLANELQYCFCEISKIDTCITAPRSDQLELNASRIPMRCCARDGRKNISLLRYSVALVASRRNAFSRVLYRSSSLTMSNALKDSPDLTQPYFVRNLYSLRRWGLHNALSAFFMRHAY